MYQREIRERRKIELDGRDRVVNFLKHLRGKSPYIPKDKLEEIGKFPGIYTEGVWEYCTWIGTDIEQYGENAAAHLCMRRETYTRLRDLGIGTLESVRVHFEGLNWQKLKGIGGPMAYEVQVSLVEFDRLLMLNQPSSTS